MKITLIRQMIFAVCLSTVAACQPHKSGHGEGGEHHPEQKIVLTSALQEDVTVDQSYVCLINSRRHIVLRAQHKEAGYLDVIDMKEGQAVKAGDVLFQIVPTLYKARLDAELAEADLALQEFNNTKKLFEDKVVSERELALFAAKLARAKAKVAQAEAELNFTKIKAPFDGIIDRLHEQQGSLIKEGDKLTTLSDNTVMWVYFNVPEARYLDLRQKQGKIAGSPSRMELVDSRIELMLANGKKFPQTAGNTITIEGEFNRETGNIPFRADFPNPDGLLRHGQTGTVIINQILKKATVIPQRTTFEILDRVYVYVVGDDKIVKQRQVEILHELDDVFVISGGLKADEKIILEGVQLVRDGQKLKDVEYKKPQDVLKNQKFHAE